MAPATRQLHACLADQAVEIDNRRAVKHQVVVLVRMSLGFDCVDVSGDKWTDKNYAAYSHFVVVL